MNRVSTTSPLCDGLPGRAELLRQPIDVVLMRFQCPVCGFDGLYESPRSSPTGGGSYEICPSCGFQFAVSDDDRGSTYESWREEWIGRGMPWSGVGRSKPTGWDPELQLRSLI
jgi:predicted RNA-binding Zn-ribbon protein involved in translation (DUF1610 family)